MAAGKISSERDEARSGKVEPRSERYTIPDNEYAQLTALKKRLLALGASAKKSQLLRAGLLLLMAMGDARLKTAVAKTELATLLLPNNVPCAGIIDPSLKLKPRGTRLTVDAGR